MRVWWLGAALAAALVGGPAAHAMKFSTVEFKPKEWAIGATGEIAPGDDLALHQVVAKLPADAKLELMLLTSPGGNLLEGTRLARTIRNTGITTGVTGTCASACFLLWAAGTTKLVERGSRVGVHSASYQGRETDMTQTVTVQMARLAREFEIPPAIIGRMVSTQPDDMAWLSDDELETVPGFKWINASASDKVVSGYEPGSALKPGGGIAPNQQALAGTTSPFDGNPARQAAPPPPNEMFVTGRQARVEWEQWFAAMTGDSHDGADWWAGHRYNAVRDRLTCENQTGNSQAWMFGCQQARSKLGPIDRFRTTSPDFKAGWNSL